MKCLALWILALVALSACSGTDAPAPNPPPASSSSLAGDPVPASNASSSASAAAPLEAAPEAISETGASSSVGNSLALKMSQQPPEPASRWQEGVHYERLSPVQPTNAPPGQVEVLEVFWYGCPHCYALDPYLESWRKNGKAANVVFTRVPVMWSPGHQGHARVFYTAEQLGRLETLHGAIFREMQVNNNQLNSTTLIEQFFVNQGVSKADFQKAFASFAVESALGRAQTLGVRYKVSSVPLIIINGKYLSDVGRAGGHQQLLALINDLAARETR